MIKRLVFVGGFTGFSHLVSLLTLSLVAKTIASDEVGVIGIIESNLLLLVQVISFGLQLSSTRDIALTSNIKKLYSEAQTARFSLSIAFIPLGLILYFLDPDPRNLVFLGAPIIALNGDYALYGKGYPVFGAFLAFVRVMMPSLALIIAAYHFKDHLFIVYIVSLFIGYILSGILTAHKLKVTYLFPPDFKKVKLYLNNFNLGLSNFAIYIIGPGIIYIGGYFFNEHEVGLFFSSFKYYIVFKGLRRILVQSFYKDLVNDAVVLKIDQIAILSAFLFAIPSIIYPETFIHLLFNKEYVSAKSSWITLGTAAICSSFVTGSGTRLLLNKDDKSFIVNFGIASIATIGILITLAQFKQTNISLAISILTGEAIISVLNAQKVGIPNYSWHRFKFLLFPLAVVLTIGFVRFTLFDGAKETFAMIISMVIYSIIVLAKYFKRFV